MTEPVEKTGKKVIFEGNWVCVDQMDDQSKRISGREWHLIRALLRHEPVHWSDGFLLFTTWRDKEQKRDYKDQFGRVASLLPKVLKSEPFGIQVKTDHPRGKPDWWKLRSCGCQILESNIADAVHVAQKSRVKFLAGDREAGWALVRESYDTYPDANSICQALASAESLPKNPKSYEKCLHRIKELLRNRRDILSHALFKVLCLASLERQGITDQIAKPAMRRWIRRIFLVESIIRGKFA